LACRRKPDPRGFQWGHRRRGWVDETSTVAGHWASMGPSTFIDGETQRLPYVPSVGFASMGPSTFIDGEMSATCLSLYLRLLQWGRRCSSTERSGRRARASGPQRFNGAVDVHRRRAHRPYSHSSGWWSLQWGRRCSSTERSPTPSCSTCSLVMLQWGRRCSSTERPARRPRAGTCSRCFNGAVDVHRRRPSFGTIAREP
jgi:hypothetical protein